MSIVRRAGWPLRRLLNPRFQWVIDAFDDRLGSRGGSRPPVHQRLDGSEARLNAIQGELAALRVLVEGTRDDPRQARRDEDIAHLRAQVQALGAAVEAREAATASLGPILEAITNEVHVLRGQTEHEHRVVTESFEALRDRLIDLDRTVADVSAEYQIPPLDKRHVADLRWPVAEFVNWATYQHGYAGQAGLWINNPVFVNVEADGVRVRNVNERIVEVPFVFAALAELDGSARILDVGGSESTIGLSLASLGHRVTLVDPRGFAIGHPHLDVAAMQLDELPIDDAPYDAALAISAIEHFGLGSYGLPEDDSRLDKQALRDLRSRLRPGGLLVLTVPYGPASVDEFQRVYDRDGLDDLLEGWDIVRSATAWPTEATVWEAGSLDEPLGDTVSHGVAMVVARRPAD